jgi:hypothetical protein
MSKDVPTVRSPNKHDILHNENAPYLRILEFAKKYTEFTYGDALIYAKHYRSCICDCCKRLAKYTEPVDAIKQWEEEKQGK